MEENFHIDVSTKAGTAGGTGLILLVHISVEEIGKTVVLAAVGAVVSFCVSLLLKMLIAKFRKK